MSSNNNPRHHQPNNDATFAYGPPMIPHDNDTMRLRRKKKRRKPNDDANLLNIPDPTPVEQLEGPAHLAASALPQGFPPELAFRALAAYSLLRTLSIELRLSPFTPNVFLRALYLPYPNSLLGQVHVALLRILLPALKMGYSYRERGNALCVTKKWHGGMWELLAGDNLTYLDGSTWPVFYDDYVHLTADGLWHRMHSKESFIDCRSAVFQMHHEETASQNKPSLPPPVPAVAGSGHRRRGQGLPITRHQGAQQRAAVSTRPSNNSPPAVKVSNCQDTAIPLDSDTDPDETESEFDGSDFDDDDDDDDDGEKYKAKPKARPNRSVSSKRQTRADRKKATAPLPQYAYPKMNQAHVTRLHCNVDATKASIEAISAAVGIGHLAPQPLAANTHLAVTKWSEPPTKRYKGQTGEPVPPLNQTTNVRIAHPLPAWSVLAISNLHGGYPIRSRGPIVAGMAPPANALGPKSMASLPVAPSIPGSYFPQTVAQLAPVAPIPTNVEMTNPTQAQNKPIAVSLPVSTLPYNALSHSDMQSKATGSRTGRPSGPFSALMHRVPNINMQVVSAKALSPGLRVESIAKPKVAPPHRFTWTGAPNTDSHEVSLEAAEAIQNYLANRVGSTGDSTVRPQEASNNLSEVAPGNVSGSHERSVDERENEVESTTIKTVQTEMREREAVSLEQTDGISTTEHTVSVFHSGTLGQSRVASDPLNANARSKSNTGQADDTLSSNNQSSFTQLPVEWPQFKPLVNMRKGIPHHRLPLDQKLCILEFLIDELLTVDFVAEEFACRETATGHLGCLYGSLPTESELESIVNQDECGVCGKEGQLLCCDACIGSYHPQCIGMRASQIPEGKWFCPECSTIDPCSFGTLPGKKASVDWFALGEVKSSENPMTERFGTTLRLAGEPQDFAPNHKLANDESSSKNEVALPVPPELKDKQFLVVHGFVFSRSHTQNGDNPATDQPSTYSCSDCLKPTSQKELHKLLGRIGPEFSFCWPLSQIPLQPLKVWTTYPNFVRSKSVLQYFDSRQSFDPSSYYNQYQKAPAPKSFHAGGGSEHPGLVLTDYVSGLGSSDMRMLRTLMTRDMSHDDRIGLRLRSSLCDFNPYEMVTSFLVTLEGKLRGSCLLSERWCIRNGEYDWERWRRDMAKCSSLYILSREMVNLIDACHPRVFLEGWFEVATPLRMPNKSALNSSDESEGARNYETLPCDWTTDSEKACRRWQRSLDSNVLSLLSAESSCLQEFFDGSKQPKGRSDRKKNTKAISSTDPLLDAKSKQRPANENDELVFATRSGPQWQPSNTVPCPSMRSPGAKSDGPETRNSLHSDAAILPGSSLSLPQSISDSHPKGRQDANENDALLVAPSSEVCAKFSEFGHESQCAEETKGSTADVAVATLSPGETNAQKPLGPISQNGVSSEDQTILVPKRVSDSVDSLANKQIEPDKSSPRESRDLQATLKIDRKPLDSDADILPGSSLGSPQPISDLHLKDRLDANENDAFLLELSSQDCTKIAQPDPDSQRGEEMKGVAADVVDLPTVAPGKTATGTQEPRDPISQNEVSSEDRTTTVLKGATGSVDLLAKKQTGHDRISPRESKDLKPTPKIEDGQASSQSIVCNDGMSLTGSSQKAVSQECAARKKESTPESPSVARISTATVMCEIERSERPPDTISRKSSAQGRSGTAEEVGAVKRTRRSGRLHHASEDVVDSVVAAAEGADLDRASRVAHHRNRRLVRLEGLVRNPPEQETHWPVAGRKLFEPVGSLPPKEAKRLGRNAGAVVAPYVRYSSFEVGETSVYHAWRKRTLRPRSFEDILMQIRVLDSFIDKETLYACEGLARRPSTVTSRVQKRICCQQRDFQTGEVDYLVVNQGTLRGCWVSSGNIDLSSLVLERSGRIQEVVNATSTIQFSVKPTNIMSKKWPNVAQTGVLNAVALDAAVTPKSALREITDSFLKHQIASSQAQVKTAQFESEVSMVVARHKTDTVELLLACKKAGLTQVSTSEMNSLRKKNALGLDEVFARHLGHGQSYQSYVRSLLGTAELHAIAHLKPVGGGSITRNTNPPPLVSQARLVSGKRPKASQDTQFVAGRQWAMLEATTPKVETGHIPVVGDNLARASFLIAGATMKPTLQAHVSELMAPDPGQLVGQRINYATNAIQDATPSPMFHSAERDQLPAFYAMQPTDSEPMAIQPRQLAAQRVNYVRSAIRDTTPSSMFQFSERDERPGSSAMQRSKQMVEALQAMRGTSCNDIRQQQQQLSGTKRQDCPWSSQLPQRDGHPSQHAEAIHKRRRQLVLNDVDSTGRQISPLPVDFRPTARTTSQQNTTTYPPPSQQQWYNASLSSQPPPDPRERQTLVTERTALSRHAQPSHPSLHQAGDAGAFPGQIMQHANGSRQSPPMHPPPHPYEHPHAAYYMHGYPPYAHDPRYHQMMYSGHSQPSNSAGRRQPAHLEPTEMQQGPSHLPVDLKTRRIEEVRQQQYPRD